VTFSLGRIYRISMFAGAAFILVVAPFVGLAAFAPDQSIGKRAFFVLWIIVIFYGLHKNLYQVAYDLQCTDDVVTWRSPLRTGTVRVSELSRIFSRWGSVGVLEAADGRRIQIYVRKGFIAFASGLAERNPNLEVNLSSYTRLIDRFPGQSAFHA
jgi:hypothetical protein